MCVVCGARFSGFLKSTPAEYSDQFSYLACLRDAFSLFVAAFVRRLVNWLDQQNCTERTCCRLDIILMFTFLRSMPF